VIQTVNLLLTGLFGLLFWPFRALAPIWSLIVFSFLTGILMVWIFGKVSSQDAIRAVRDRIRGNLMGIRLFGDNIGVLFRLQGRILRDTAVYLKFALVPLLIMLVPVLLILTQLNLRYSVRPLEPGEAVLVKATLRDPAAMLDGVALEVPDGLAVETPGVRLESLGEVSWRVRPSRQGRYEVSARAGESTVTKELLVGAAWRAVSPLRTASLVDGILHPGEPPIDSGSLFKSVEVRYERRELFVFGWGVDWLVVFCVMSIVAGFALRGVLGVEI
jgi:hypothetical protein